MEDLETEILYSIRDTMAAMESESCDFHMEATVYKNGVVQEERCRDGYYDKDRSTVILDVTKKPNKQLDKEARLDSEISYQEAGESKPCHPFDKHFWKPALENTCDGARLAKHNEEMECVHILVDNDMPAQELTCVLISPSHACAHFPTIQATTVAHTQMGVCQALGVDPYTHIKVRLLGDVMDDPTNSFVLLYPEVVTDKENTCVHELRDKKTGEAWQKIYGPMLILRRNGKTLESLSMREAALNVITEAYHQTIVPAKDADYCKGCPENCKFYD